MFVAIGTDGLTAICSVPYTVCIGKIFGTLYTAPYKQADRFTE